MPIFEVEFKVKVKVEADTQAAAYDHCTSVVVAALHEAVDILTEPGH